MSALCNSTLPLGLGDEDFADDLQALMPGSPFDLLLGSTGGALLDLSKVGDSLSSLVQVFAKPDIALCSCQDNVWSLAMHLTEASGQISQPDLQRAV